MNGSQHRVLVLELAYKTVDLAVQYPVDEW